MNEKKCRKFQFAQIIPGQFLLHLFQFKIKHLPIKPLLYLPSFSISVTRIS